MGHKPSLEHCTVSCETLLGLLCDFVAPRILILHTSMKKRKVFNFTTHSICCNPLQPKDLML